MTKTEVREGCWGKIQHARAFGISSGARGRGKKTEVRVGLVCSVLNHVLTS